jgi:TRAP-type C4-dicarboxylate transport system permease small subunit
MDNRVIKKFFGYLLWGFCWLVCLVGGIAGMMYLSIMINGTLSLLPIFVGITFVMVLGTYMLWHYCHIQVAIEDRHNELRDKRNARH